jgi:mono/diheme cytochrome c family protein
MSSPNPHSKPDLDETINVIQAHARVASEFSSATREKHLAESGRESVPLWVITACGVVLLIAGGVLGNAGTLFSYDNTFRANYVRGTAPGSAVDGPQPKTALMAFSAKGSKIYSAKCNGCHGADGKGDGVNYPSLVGSTNVIEENQQLAMVILNGIQGPISNGKTYGAGIMPAQGAGMTAEDLAGVMTYVRNNFGNSTGDVVSVEMAKSAIDVSAAREKAGQSVTSEEILAKHKVMLSGADIAPEIMVNPATLAPVE